MKIRIGDLMQTSGVTFGTSGARGLSADMTDLVCYAYTQGFLQYLQGSGELKDASRVALGGDLRPSTDRILAAVQRAVGDLGHEPLLCGKLPSPAVALYGLARGIPAVMVTGSHIPADRNGIKFNKIAGEILKQDEAGVREQTVRLDRELFDETGAFVCADAGSPPCIPDAQRQYVSRYLDFFPRDGLKGKKLGLYQHSAVGRDLLREILEGLGAEVIALGRSDVFVPVDTEAIRPEDVELAKRWVAETGCDAVVSTDGDSDRPLLSDEHGNWLRGDVAGILCARYLGATAVVTPVSCNSAVEACGWFQEVRRTRIGSPYVIEGMQEAEREGHGLVVGYEANGGFLTQNALAREGRMLAALPTRDAALPILSILLSAAQRNIPVSALLNELPPRFTASGRLQNFPTEVSAVLLARFHSGDEERDRTAMEKMFGPLCGALRSVDRTDGLRMRFVGDEVVHLRPSGNAPEFRCYTEAATESRAARLNDECLDLLARLSARL